MNFEPRTEQEIQDSKLWKKGDYDFECLEGADKTSKTSGKPMIELRLRLTDNKTARTITDYLLAETPEKLRHAASACGLLDKYDSGDLPGTAFKGKKGKVRLGVEKDKKRVYPDKRSWPILNWRASKPTLIFALTLRLRGINWTPGIHGGAPRSCGIQPRTTKSSSNAIWTATTCISRCGMIAITAAS